MSMTETAFQQLINRSYQRLSAHQIDFVRVNTKYLNEQKRRGSYYFLAPLSYPDEQDQPRRIICEIMYNPAFSRHFIHHTLNTPPETVNDYIDQLLAENEADRNQVLLRILSESALREQAVLEIKQGIAHALRNLKFWNYQRGKGQFRDAELGTFYLRPLREEF